MYKSFAVSTHKFEADVAMQYIKRIFPRNGAQFECDAFTNVKLVHPSMMEGCCSWNIQKFNRISGQWTDFKLYSRPEVDISWSLRDRNQAKVTLRLIPKSRWQHFWAPQSLS